MKSEIEISIVSSASSHFIKFWKHQKTYLRSTRKKIISRQHQPNCVNIDTHAHTYGQKCIHKHVYTLNTHKIRKHIMIVHTHAPIVGASVLCLGSTVFCFFVWGLQSSVLCSLDSVRFGWIHAYIWICNLNIAKFSTPLCFDVRSLSRYLLLLSVDSDVSCQLRVVVFRLSAVFSVCVCFALHVETYNFKLDPRSCSPPASCCTVCGPLSAV
jgi:hypothetical protein